MKKQFLELVKYLCNHTNPITSKELSGALSISQRSVNSYVKSLNVLANKQMITSSINGYYIDKKIASELLQNEEKQVPQTSDERAHYIIKQILILHSPFLDIYELCDIFYVSYSTIKSDVFKMNRAFSNFSVEFNIKNDKIYIFGTEKNKRKLVSYIIYEETSNQFMNIEIIRNSFSSLPINKINTILLEIFSKHFYYINEFANINMLLHIAIIIERIKEGNFVNIDENFLIDDEVEQAIINEICEAFEKEFNIKFNNSERYEIYILFKTSANYSLQSSSESLRKIVGGDLIDHSLKIVNKVNDYYYIDLSSENFLTPFALHLKNLLIRAKNEVYTKNPMAHSIKTSCPIVYDIAIFFSIELMDTYGIRINEDEVAFLALHIGAEIERQKTNDTKLKCVLFCPNYMEIPTQLYNQLLIEYGSLIDIIKVALREDELDENYFDFCLSTIEINKNLNQEFLLISPFLQAFDKENIYNLINKISYNKKNLILETEFDRFFNESLFFENLNLSNRKEVLHIMSQKLVDLNMVDSTFEEKVITRENAASTAFGRIAIPHAIKMEAFKTCICVYISKEGISWDSNSVNIVLLMAINRADKRIFHELYEALVNLFAQDSSINRVKESRSFLEFKKIMFSLINKG